MLLALSAVQGDQQMESDPSSVSGKRSKYNRSMNDRRIEYSYVVRAKGNCLQMLDQLLSVAWLMAATTVP